MIVVELYAMEKMRRRGDENEHESGTMKGVRGVRRRCGP